MIEDDHIIIDSKLIYNGPVKLKLDTFKINGKIFRKEVVEHNASVGIITITNNKEIILIKQYRHAVNEYLIEIPAGKIEDNESPIEAAKKELEEETGFTVLCCMIRKTVKSILHLGQDQLYFDYLRYILNIKTLIKNDLK